MIGCLRTRVRKQPIVALNFESETVYFVLAFFPASATDSEKQDLYQELEIMRKVPRHNNIVTLLGCCTRIGKDH